MYLHYVSVQIRRQYRCGPLIQKRTAVASLSVESVSVVSVIRGHHCCNPACMCMCTYLLLFPFPTFSFSPILFNGSSHIHHSRYPQVIVEWSTCRYGKTTVEVNSFSSYHFFLDKNHPANFLFIPEEKLLLMGYSTFSPRVKSMLDRWFCTENKAGNGEINFCSPALWP